MSEFTLGARGIVPDDSPVNYMIKQPHRPPASKIDDDKTRDWRAKSIYWLVWITFVLQVSTLGFIVSMVLSSPAHADTNGYINQLNETGVPMLSGPFPPIQAGYTACQMIGDGVPPADVAGQVAGLWSGVIGGRVVDAAQRNLCPETLPAP
jgi:hypothetical protein